MKKFLFTVICAMSIGAAGATDLGRLQREYNDNEIAFNKKYLGTDMEIEAKIEAIKSDAYMDMDAWGNVRDIAGLELNPIDVDFSFGAAAIALMQNDDDLDTLKRGQTIRLKCRLFVPEITFEDLYFKDCEIVK